MKTIYEAKDLIRSNFGRRVIVKVHGVRNKIDMVEGIISECYKRIFIVTTKFGKKSFTYSDVLTGSILVKIV